MSLEIEVRFVAQQKEPLLIAWIEGGGQARLVATAPGGEREEIQIKKMGASLLQEANELLKESFVPQKTAGAGITAKLQIVTERARVGRTVPIGEKDSRAELFCLKLLSMANLLAKDPGVISAIKEITKAIG